MHQEDTISIALGAILYLRDFFPEDSFEPACVGHGITLRTLKRNLQTRKMAGWISEVVRHKDSICSVALEIHDAASCEKSMAEPMETYLMDTEKEADLKAICRAVQRMSPLSGRFFLRIRVHACGPVKLKGFKSESHAWAADGNAMEVSNIRIIHRTGTVHAGSAAPRSQSIIDCLCTINNNERDMLQCRRCLGWVHAVCCGYFSSQDPRVPGGFRCFRCLGKASKELRDLCVYRRALYIVFNEDFPSIDLGERLKITRGMVRKVLFRLRADGLVRQREGRYEAVWDRKSREKVKEYFNEARTLCFVSVGKVECTL